MNFAYSGASYKRKRAGCTLLCLVSFTPCGFCRCLHPPVVGTPLIKVSLLGGRQILKLRRGAGNKDGQFILKAGLGAPCPGLSDLSSFSTCGGFLSSEALGRSEAGLYCHLVTILDSAPTDARKGLVGWGDCGSGKWLGPQITEHVLSTCMISLCVCIRVYRHDLD